MVQSISREKFKIQVPKSKMESFMQLTDFSNEILFIHPTTSLFFDKLTMIKFSHNEILCSEDLHLDFIENLFVNRMKSLDLEVFNKNSLEFKVVFHEKELKFKCVSPEFGLIWILQNINSMSVLIALAILEFCNIKILKEHKNLFSSLQILKLIMKLGEIPLNRYDIIWQIIKDNQLTDKLYDFPLVLDRNIRNERRYDKIL